MRPSLPKVVAMQTGRHFSLEAANALLPMVREAFREARPLQQRMVEVAAEMRNRGFAPRPIGRGGPVPAGASAWQEELESLAARIEVLLEPLGEVGIEVKSAEGLVDFRSLHHGRTVLLCWRWDEPKIDWFHELEAGYAGRRRIEDPEAFEGDLLN